ncbi:MAG: hypothetical protein M1834_008158 [Cirrosporium novae-zelandiae]|nr:MAG: hypothetical protein M1834_008158 [Cirrosporium novae-zelandiae]
MSYANRQAAPHSRKEALVRSDSILRMYPTARLLLQQSSRITLFTRVNCSLCTIAKTTLIMIQKRRPFEYREIDVMAPGQKRWRDIYEFDTPVIHVQKNKQEAGEPDLAAEAKKLMHRFTEEEVETLMDEAERA